VNEIAVLLDGRAGGDPQLLGGKAAGIQRMMALGAPVPSAFALTTEVCRWFYADSRRVPPLVWQLLPGLIGELELATGATFGRGPRPLLVSVRSGAATSMPGMMDTILNVGLTPATARVLGPHSADTGARFAAQFAKVVGRPAPEDPWEQLRLAITAVLASWMSPRALAYRTSHGLDHDGGTAVTVQAMVFGNRDDRSGTGVVFSRDPLTGDNACYGEWLPRGQGEDVVSGQADARPLSELAEHLPPVHRDLLAWAEVLERESRDVQDIEFTVESGTLWLLQSRVAKRSPEAALRHAVAMAEEGLITRAQALARLTPAQLEAVRRPVIAPEHTAAATALAWGKPASPGVGVGVIGVDTDTMAGQAADGASIVLARPTTDPGDVAAMSLACAVLTESGGSTSHAAVVCRELAVPCVVGCGAGTVTALAGRLVTVDGSAGLVYDGALPIRQAGAQAGADLVKVAEWARSVPGTAGAAALGRLPHEHGVRTG
jgi:pyruvate,orthophosphate dikinase